MFINHIVVKTQNHQKTSTKNNNFKNGLLHIKLSLKSQLTLTLG